MTNDPKPGEPGHWRYKKDMAIKKAREERIKANYSKKQSDKDEHGNPLPGTPGHWRYKKDMGIKTGTTGMKNFGKAAEEPPKPEEKTKPPEKIKLSKAELFALTKTRQTEIIKELGGDDAKVPRYEKDRVAMILKLQG